MPKSRIMTEDELILKYLLDKKADTTYSTIWANNDGLGLVRATDTYIPISDFRETFLIVESLVRTHKITKLIFDKRELKVFDQKSMEWYFTEWKDRMFDEGLQIHRKILPDDTVFVECVILGREKISEKYPESHFHKMDIAYASDLQDAIEN